MRLAIPKSSLAIGIVVLCFSVAPAQVVHWVSRSSSGKLVYARTALGDRIADYSSAGYRGGGVALPVVPTRRILAPSGGDDTAAIQRAIDEVSVLPLENGHRGAVDLSSGEFHCSGVISITASGVVLRGAGKSARGTTIIMTGKPHLAIHIAGELHQKAIGQPTDITDNYVPSGTSTLHVADATGLHAGDTVLIVKPVTAAWEHFMGMDDMQRDGKPEHWVSTTHLDVRRRIAAVAGNTITLEVPLMDSYDTKFFEGARATVTRVEVSGQIAEDGVENLRIVAPQRIIPFGVPEFDALTMEDAVDSWVQSVAMEETTSGLMVGSGTERVTVRLCDVVNHVTVTTSAKPSVYGTNGSQILFDRCTGSGDTTFYFVTQARQQGPVVLLHCHFLGNGHVQPHQRWSTGLLIDNCDAPGGGIDLMNRGEMGTGHGWAIGWAVAWNNTAKSFEMNDPPQVANWSIGNRGEAINPPFPTFDGSKRAPLQDATIESQGRPVSPQSLYLAQLAERLGRGALKNIGY